MSVRNGSTRNNEYNAGYYVGRLYAQGDPTMTSQESIKRQGGYMRLLIANCIAVSSPRDWNDGFYDGYCSESGKQVQENMS